jgi:hypothetical protein
MFTLGSSKSDQENDLLGCTKINHTFLDQKLNTPDRAATPKTSPKLPSFSSTSPLHPLSSPPPPPAALRSPDHAARALPQALAASPPRRRPCGRGAPAAEDQVRLPRVSVVFTAWCRPLSFARHLFVLMPLPRWRPWLVRFSFGLVIGACRVLWLGKPCLVSVFRGYGKDSGAGRTQI